MGVNIRKATLADVDFLIEAIIAAEYSGTEILSFNTIFEMDEDTVYSMLRGVLEKNEPGCELTTDNFLIAEVDDKDTTGVKHVAACVCGWIEGDNEAKQPSQTIKANLMSSHMPLKSLMALRRNSAVLKDLHVSRPEGSYQLEYVYCRPEYRKQGIIQSIMAEHEKKAKQHGCKDLYILLCAHNVRAIESYHRFGFYDYQFVHSDNAAIKSLLPDDTKVLMRKEI